MNRDFISYSFWKEDDYAKWGRRGLIITGIIGVLGLMAYYNSDTYRLANAGIINSKNWWMYITRKMVMDVSRAPH